MSRQYVITGGTVNEVTNKTYMVADGAIQETANSNVTIVLSKVTISLNPQSISISQGSGGGTTGGATYVGGFFMGGLGKPSMGRLGSAGTIGGGSSGGGSSFKPLLLPGTPLAIYSVLQNTGWAGKCLRVQRSTDSTQMDIGFVKGYVDIATATTFASSGTLTVVTWYDQSGNAFDAISGTNAVWTGAAPPTLISSNALVGLQPISFMGTNGFVGNQFLKLPAGLTVNQQSFSMFLAVAPQVGGYNAEGFIGLGVDTVTGNNNLGIYRATGGHVSYVPGALQGNKFAFSCVPNVLGFTGNASALVSRINGVKQTYSPGTNVATAGGNIGNSSSTTLLQPAAEYFAVVIYGTQLVDSDCALVEASMNTSFNITPAPTKAIVFDGDSITSGYTGPISMQNLERQTLPLLNGNPAIGMFNLGINGQGMSALYTNRATPIAHYDATRLKNIGHVFAGTNDIDGTASGSIVGVGASTFNTYLLPYIQAMQTTGFKMVVCTMLPRAWSGSGTDQSQKETERLSYNSLIASNASANNYTVVDFASLFPTPSVYTTVGIYSSDGVHPTILTFSMMAPLSAAAINSQ